VLRYDTSHGTDGLSGSEGVPRLRKLADNYAFVGRIRAEGCSSSLLKIRNTWGFSRRYDPGCAIR
jgi:hypothetical protein